MRQFVNHLKRVAGRLEPLIKATPMVAKGGGNRGEGEERKEEEKARKKPAREGCRGRSRK